jgi:hypothetical protein
MFGGTAFVIVTAFNRPIPYNGIAGMAALVLVYVASLASAIYLLKADARAWFSRRNPD